MAALDDTFGAVLIGVIVAGVLYGFTCVQTWYYYITYPLDPWYIKFLVAGLLVSDTAHQAVISHVVYTYLVTFFGETEQIEKIVWSMIAEVFFNGFTTLVVQCFLTVRVYKLSSRSWLATVPVIILIVAEYIGILIFGIKALRFKTFQQLTTFKGLSMTINALAAAGDLLIAILLCYMLQISRTGIRKSDTLINRLMIFSINTGLVTSLCALASLISISIWPHAFIYIAFYFCIGRLYCNTLLATLNARKILRGGSVIDDPTLSSRRSSKGFPRDISIGVETTKEYIPDEERGIQS